MSDAIRLLECLGAAPVAAKAGARSIMAAGWKMPAAQRGAMRDRDPEALRALAGRRGTMCCLIIPPEPDQAPMEVCHDVGSGRED